MKQFELQQQLLVLKVKKPSLFLRGFLLFLAIVTFFLPFFGIIGSLLSGSGLHIAYFIGLGIFSLLSFHLLRMFLWNTYGQEKFLFHNKEIIYEADYGWFKDGKTIIPTECMQLSIIPIGYDEEKLGMLLLKQENKTVQSVVKIPIEQLEELIILLSKKSNATHSEIQLV